MNSMEWISTSDRLPKHEGVVLAIVTETICGITLDHLYELARHVPAEGWILDPWTEADKPAFTVTHWMELPELPGTPKTNGDRIRGMSDEVLAYLLTSLTPFCDNLGACIEALDNDIDIPEEQCVECALRWLRSTAGEAEQ